MATAQTVLFQEDFNTGGSGFTLNTTDMGSVNGVYNTWVVNSSYAGGSVNAPCPNFGFNLPITIAATPNQPAGITGNPNSGYMHITSVAGVTSGVTNCHFQAGDAMFCGIPSENYFAAMNSDVSTIGNDTVKVSFWWLCTGATANYGELYYSTNSGTNWTVATPPANYQGQAAWVQQTVTMPVFSNQATLRFGFRFVNGVLPGGTDPAFGVDDFTVTGINGSLNSITTGALTSQSLCAGSNFQVPYLAAGMFNAGNTFTAQLSNASGSFASPTVIGTLSSTTSGMINCSLPASTPAGSGYLIRVMSSDPVVLGSVSSTTLTVNALPNATANNNSPVCAGGTVVLIAGGGAVYSWSGPASYTSTVQNPTIAPVTAANSGVYTVSVTDANGCTATAQTTVTVDPCLGIEDEAGETISIYPNPAAEHLTVSVPESWAGNYHVSLVNELGQVVMKAVPLQSTYVFNIGTLVPGIYIVEALHKDQRIVQKLIVR